jgi:AcrR family transcriptional regulator
MPPRTRYTAERILDAALALTRVEGVEGVTARNLAGALECSTAPIFSRFTSMESVHEALVDRIIEEFVHAVGADLSGDPIVAAGEGWLRFACEEPRLYEAVFLRRHPWHVKWGRIRLQMADRMATDSRYSDWDRAGLFALVGRISVVMHGLGVEVWSGRLDVTNPRLLVEQFVLPVVAAAQEHGWTADLHSAAPAVPAHSNENPASS